MSFKHQCSASGQKKFCRYLSLPVVLDITTFVLRVAHPVLNIKVKTVLDAALSETDAPLALGDLKRSPGFSVSIESTTSQQAGFLVGCCNR